MDGITIKIFYGYRYYDDEYDIEKTDYDYEIIGDSQGNERGFTGDTRGISNSISKNLRNIIQVLRVRLREE